MKYLEALELMVRKKHSVVTSFHHSGIMHFSVKKGCMRIGKSMVGIICDCPQIVSSFAELMYPPELT